MQPGNITAIMGASGNLNFLTFLFYFYFYLFYFFAYLYYQSGAGKTTFLDILSGRKNTGIVTGEIYLNDSLRDMRTFKRLAGYSIYYYF